MLDTPAALRKAKAGSRVVIEVEGATEPLEIAINDVLEIPDIVARLVADGSRIIRVTPDRRSLEDVYLELVGADR